jgi:hypothetical protein
MPPVQGKFVCSLVRVCCLLGALSAAFAALFMCFTTSGPVPRTFTSWSELGYLPPWENGFNPIGNRSGPRFICFSDCGRYYALKEAQPLDVKWPPFIVAIHETLSKRRVLQLNFGGILPDAFCITPDAKYMICLSGYQHLHVFRWPSGETIQKDIDLQSDASATLGPIPDSQTVLLSTHQQASMWDYRTGQRVDCWSNPWRLSHWRVFLQADGALMAIVSSSADDVRLLDVTSGQILWELQGENLWFEHWPNFRFGGRVLPIGAGLGSEALSPDRSKFAQRASAGALALLRVSDGELLRLQPHLPGYLVGPLFSSDSKYLAAFSLRADPLKELVLKLPQSIRIRSVIKLDDRVQLAIFDTETGQIWPNLQVNPITCLPLPHARFVKDESRLMTLTEDGLYEWDLPPRWRYVTPLVWPIGMSALALLWIWRRLILASKRQLSLNRAELGRT